MFWRRFSLFNQEVLAPYLAHQLLVLLAGYFAVIFFPGHYDPKQFFAFVEQRLNRWDSGWYLKIAETGYNEKSAAFFPLYPLLIHLLQQIGVDPAGAGILISNFSLWGAMTVFYRLASMDFEPRTARRALWYLALFPTAFYFSAIYTESLYLFLVLLTFYFARIRKWLGVGVAGMLAAATRNMGIFLLLPVLWEYRQAGAGKIKKDILFLGLIPLGLLLFMEYLKLRLGNPLAFLDAQQYWYRSFAWPWSSFVQVVVHLRENYRFARNLLDLSFTMFGFVLFLLSLGKSRPSYQMFVFTGLLVPLFPRHRMHPFLACPGLYWYCSPFT